MLADGAWEEFAVVLDIATHETSIMAVFDVKGTKDGFGQYHYRYAKSSAPEQISTKIASISHKQ